MWAAAQARRFTASATEDELSDEDSVEDGVLEATEKEELRALSLDQVLDECDRPTVRMGGQGATENTQDDSDASQDDQTVSALRRVVEQCTQESLRHRQVSAMLHARLSERARETEAGRGDGVPTKAGKSCVEGCHKRTCGPASEGCI